jgi:hypothetical protein
VPGVGLPFSVSEDLPQVFSERLGSTYQR